MDDLTTNNIYKTISELLIKARASVQKIVNTTMTYTYFEIGKLIVEEEQNGEERAGYGKELIKNLSEKLTEEFGKGFSKRNLANMKKFYSTYSILQKPSAKFELSFSHYIILSNLSNIDERNFYEIESINNGWSVPELRRQLDSSLYERLTLSRDKEEIKELPKYSENDLESAIITHIENFIMELGKGFLFQGRQVRFSFDEEHFFVDLVFYNRILKCFVLIDLKIGKLKHQDLGQMQMYVNYYDRFVKMDDENKTIGIIICKEKSDTLVEITLPKENEQIFASRYMTILPSKEELIRIVEEEN